MKRLSNQSMCSCIGGQTLDAEETTAGIAMVACTVATVNLITALIAGPTCGGMIIGYFAAASQD